MDWLRSYCRWTTAGSKWRLAAGLGGPSGGVQHATDPGPIRRERPGPVRVAKAVLPSMRQRRSGLIIHISSTLGRVLPGSGGLYPATKWALEGLAESLGYEVKAFGIEAVIVEPGAFPSPSISKAVEPQDEDRKRTPQHSPTL